MTNSRALYLNDAKQGTLWSNNVWKRIVMQVIKKGTLLKVYNSSSKSTKSKQISFTHVAFSLPVVSNIYINSAGEASSSLPPVGFLTCLLGIVDQRGHVYVLDFPQNRYSLVARTGIPATCLAFNSTRRREIIVGLANCSIHCYNTDNGQLIAKLPTFHKSEPLHFSTHPTEHLALSSSFREVILWDTEHWIIKKVLSGTPNIAVEQASFSPTGKQVITCYSDSTIILWDLTSFSSRQILDSNWIVRNIDANAFFNKNNAARNSYFCCSKNAEFLVYSGIGGNILVWNLYEERFLHKIVIPSFNSCLISQIEFIGDSFIVGVLSDYGAMVFIDVESVKQVGELATSHYFKSFSVSPDGKVISLVYKDSKHTMGIFSLQEILHPEINQDSVADFENIPEPPKEDVFTHTLEKPKTFHELVVSQEESPMLNRKKLKTFLKQFGSFPDKYRVLVWRYLLKLPENKNSFEPLACKGIHPSFSNFRKKFPLKSEKLARAMERVLSSLAYWSPIFEDLEYLPNLIFPFIKLFENDTFTCLESVMTIILNWCQKWWEYYPNPPIEILSGIEELLQFACPELLAHFVKHNITAQIYAWIPLQSFFSDIFAKDDWLSIWDHLLINKPIFIYFIIAAYLKCFKVALMGVSTLNDYLFFFQRENPVSIDKLLAQAYQLYHKVPLEAILSPKIEPNIIKGFTPLMKDAYPIFNQYPTFIVNYRNQVKERIRREEQEYLRKRKMNHEIKKLSEDLKKDKMDWENNDWVTNTMVDKWWDTMISEEAKRGEKEEEISDLEKEQRVLAMQGISQARKSFLEQQRKNTAHHIKTLSRVVGLNRLNQEKERDEEELLEKFDKIEDEWFTRKQELLRNREEIHEREQERISRLVNQVETLGLKETEEEYELAKRGVLLSHFPSAIRTNIPVSPVKVSPEKSAAELHRKKVDFI